MTLNLQKYYSEYQSVIKPDWLFDRLNSSMQMILDVRNRGGKVIFTGNGASAAIASHAALDFTKQAGVNSITFHDPALITAYVNDYGGNYWLLELCKKFVSPIDLVVFISVSGESPNVVMAAKELAKRNIKTISFTGKSSSTTLAKNTDLNLRVNSNAYNVVECVHMIWITTVIDMIIGKSIYSVS